MITQFNKNKQKLEELINSKELIQLTPEQAKGLGFGKLDQVYLHPNSPILTDSKLPCKAFIFLLGPNPQVYKICKTEKQELGINETTSIIDLYYKTTFMPYDNNLNRDAA